MAINRVSIASESVKTNTESVIEVLYTRPPLADATLTTPQTPGKLLAYYNGADDTVRLYIVSRSGLHILPM